MAAHRNQSEAYDLSLFEKKTPKLVALKPNKKALKAEKRKARIQSFLNAAAVALSTLVIVGVLALMLTNRAQLTELNRQISTKEEELQTLQDEYKSIANDLASKTSAQEVEKYATEVLGMQKAESGQIQYITVNGEDIAEVTGDNGTSWLEQIVHTVSEFFANLAYQFE